MTHKDAVLRALEIHPEGVTIHQLLTWGIGGNHPTKRLTELAKAGYPIDRNTWRKLPDGKRVKVYRLTGEPGGAK